MPRTPRYQFTTTVRFDAAEAQLLQTFAAESGRSVSSVVREAVHRYLRSQRRTHREDRNR